MAIRSRSSICMKAVLKEPLHNDANPYLAQDDLSNRTPAIRAEAVSGAPRSTWRNLGGMIHKARETSPKLKIYGEWLQFEERSDGKRCSPWSTTGAETEQLTDRDLLIRQSDEPHRKRYRQWH